jgi:hypothetical protein
MCRLLQRQVMRDVVGRREQLVAGPRDHHQRRAWREKASPSDRLVPRLISSASLSEGNHQRSGGHHAAVAD